MKIKNNLIVFRQIVPRKKQNGEERVSVNEAKILQKESAYEMDEVMKNGYQEMAEINLKIAELCFCVEAEVHDQVEQIIAESE